MRRLVIAMLPLLLGNVGCSVLLKPGEQQCAENADCEARGFAGAVCNAGVCEDAPDLIWGCLGNVVEPVPDPTKKVSLSVGLTLAIEKTPVTDAVVDVCDKLDLDCIGTSANYPKGLKPDAQGIVTFDVVQGFDGFVRVEGTGLVKSRVYVGRPIVTPPKIKNVRLLTTGDYSILISYAGEVEDKTRGSSIILEVDCQGDPASGVSFQTADADSHTKEFYLVNQTPTTPPAATATDVDGFGGFFNMPASGSAVARSFRASDGVYIGESSFQVLADTISYVQIAPTPK